MKLATPLEMMEAIRRLYDREKIDNLLVSDDKTAFIADAWNGRVMTIKRVDGETDESPVAAWSIYVSIGEKRCNNRKTTLVDAHRQTVTGVLRALAFGGVF